jgi:hypothetical protein
MKLLYSTSGIMKNTILNQSHFIYINRHFVLCIIIFHFVSINNMYIFFKLLVISMIFDMTLSERNVKSFFDKIR